MLPVFFSLGPITIYSFGFLLALGFFLAAFISWRRLRELGLDEEKVIDFILLSGLLGLLFSKLVFWVANSNLAGFSFWGGFLGPGLVLLWFSKKEKWDFWQIADEVTFGILPFSVLVQIGAFLDGTTLGRPTSMPWGIYSPGSLLRSQPVSLFFAIALFLIWVFLLWIERQWRIWEWYKSKNNGLVVLTFLGLALMANFLVAFLHNIEIYWWYWMEIGMSFLGALASGIVLYCRSRRDFRKDLVVLLKGGRIWQNRTPRPRGKR